MRFRALPMDVLRLRSQGGARSRVLTLGWGRNCFGGKTIRLAVASRKSFLRKELRQFSSTIFHNRLLMLSLDALHDYASV
jgi:hypothetical protein